MKKVFVYVLIAIAACGCSFNRYTYIAQMPNEPMIEKAGEIKVAGAKSWTHFEAQASASVSRYGGLTCNYFIGLLGQHAFEYGLTACTPIRKSKLHLGFSVLKSAGKIDLYKNIPQHPWDGNYYTKINATFTGMHYQPCIYYITRDENGNKLKIGLAAKISYIHYEHLLLWERYFFGEGHLPEWARYADIYNHNFVSVTPFALLTFEGRYLFVTGQAGLQKHTFLDRLGRPDLKSTYHDNILSLPMINVAFGLKLDILDLWKK